MHFCNHIKGILVFADLQAFFVKIIHLVNTRRKIYESYNRNCPCQISCNIYNAKSVFN